MAAYIDMEPAKTMSELRLVLPPGRPNPWGEALKGICYVKKIPYVRVRKAQGHDPALQAWTSQSSAPVAVWNDERPRSTWIEQLYLAERLAPQPALTPEDVEDRVLTFGYGNELCGENGFGWSRRVMMLHTTLSNPQSEESARAFASYLGGKYGYSRTTAAAAPHRVAQILRLLGTRLEHQRAQGSSTVAWMERSEIQETKGQVSCIYCPRIPRCFIQATSLRRAPGGNPSPPSTPAHSWS